MTERFSFNIGVVIACVIAIGMIFLSERAAAQIACQPGEHQATESDLAAMKAAGIPNPQVGECWNPNSQYTGQATAQAKQDLSGMVCNSGVNIQNLDANFAVCADKFMKALRQVNPGACVESGYRNNSDQLKACLQICGASSCPGKCAAPGLSFHQKGLAIDVSHISNNQQAWQIAISSTGGGVANPSGLHSSDPDHFQATGSACSGAPVPASDTTDVYTGTQTGPTPTPAAAPQATQPATPVPAQQPVQQPVQPAQTAQQTTPATPTVTPTSPLTTTATSAAASALSSLFQTTPIAMFSTATSAAQAINIMTNLNSATSGTSSVDQNLTTIVNDIIPGNVSTTTQTSASNTQSISYPEDTFSSDAQAYAPAPVSGIGQILQALKGILTSLLSFLQSL